MDVLDRDEITVARVRGSGNTMVEPVYVNAEPER